MANIKMTLTTISPIHIGCDPQQLSANEFVAKGKYCYVIDRSKFSALLVKENLRSQFSDAIRKEKAKFRLDAFLKDYISLDDALLESISSYRMEAQAQIDFTNPSPFIRDALYNPYIPGTSIKGAIRTAIMFSIFEKMRQREGTQYPQKLVSYVEKRLEQINNAPDWQKRKGWFKSSQKQSFAESLSNEIFQHYNISTSQRYFGPHTDIMRALKVSDSITPVDGLIVEQVMLMSTRRNETPYNKNDTILCVECLPEDQTVSFTLTVDENILKHFQKNAREPLPFNSAGDILQIIADFAERQWRTDSDYLFSLPNSRDVDLNDSRGFYDQQDIPNFRFGWGTGLLGTTVDLLLPPELRKEIRNTLFVNRDDDEAPKSRRLIVSDEHKPYWADVPLGWCEIKVG